MAEPARGRRRDSAGSPRHRVGVANKALKRVTWQRRQFTSDFAKAGDDREKLRVVFEALRAASAPGSHQPGGQPPDLGEAITSLRSVLGRLHQAQESHAHRVLEQENKRIRRKEAAA